jgi:hypothetical protein
MSRKVRPIPRDVAEEGPFVGALLRLAWQRIRERIYLGVQSEGYSDLGAAHMRVVPLQVRRAKADQTRAENADY